MVWHHGWSLTHWSLLDTNLVCGMSSQGTSSVPCKRDRCSRDANPAFSLSCLRTSSVPGTRARLPIRWGAPQCGLQRPLVWHHGWSRTHWHGLAGHDVVSGLHLPLPILWGGFQCDLRARGSLNASCVFSMSQPCIGSVRGTEARLPALWGSI